MGYERKILRHIMLAQIASDGGKDIDDMMDVAPSVWKSGYKVKDLHIEEAIEEIAKRKCTGVHYYVVDLDDSWGGAPYLVYFNFKLGGKRYQISFHSFDYDLGKYCTNRGQKCVTNWDERSSRDAAWAIWRYLYANDSYYITASEGW